MRPRGHVTVRADVGIGHSGGGPRFSTASDGRSGDGLPPLSPCYDRREGGRWKHTKGTEKIPLTGRIRDSSTCPSSPLSAALFGANLRRTAPGGGAGRIKARGERGDAGRIRNPGG